MNAVVKSEFKQAEIAQLDFDKKYITSPEICKRLGVTRVAIHVRRKGGHLPGAVVIEPALLVLWERTQIEPFLVQWETHLARKGSAMA